MHQYSVFAWSALNVHMHFRSEAAPPPAKGTAFGVVAASLRKYICTFNVGHAHTEYWCVCSLGFTWKHRAINGNVTETEALKIFLNRNERKRKPQKFS